MRRKPANQSQRVVSGREPVRRPGQTELMAIRLACAGLHRV